jgi:hypothetical protein
LGALGICVGGDVVARRDVVVNRGQSGGVHIGIDDLDHGCCHDRGTEPLRKPRNLVSVVHTHRTILAARLSRHYCRVNTERNFVTRESTCLEMTDKIAPMRSRR